MTEPRSTVPPSPRSRLSALLLALAVVTAAPGAVPSTTVPSTQAPSTTVPSTQVRAEDLPRSPMPADQARDKAREVLNRREYGRAKPSLPEQWYQRFLRWLAQRLGTTTVQAVEGYGPVALAILAVLAGLVVFVVARQIRLGARRAAKKGKSGDVVLGEGGRPAERWLQEAEEFERQSQFRSAVRCQWRALVADAAALRLVIDDTGRTTGDHRRDLAAALPAVTVPFGSATDLFEHAWYSPHPIVHGDLQRMKHWAAEIRSRFPTSPVARFGGSPAASDGAAVESTPTGSGA